MERLASLEELDLQCAASLESRDRKPRLAEENVRGYVVLLSAHFQGFCRDLYAECAQIVASKVRPSLQLLIQSQFTAQYALQHGNPNLQNLKRDFSRFGIQLDLSVEQESISRLRHLAELNEWRNIAAHHGLVPHGGVPTLATLRDWRSACDDLATILDRIMYNQLRKLLRRQPWAS